MGDTDHGPVWPPAVHIELTADEDPQDGTPPVRVGRFEYHVNLDPGEVAYTVQMSAAMPNGTGFQGEQVILGGSLFTRGRLQGPDVPDDGPSDWVEMPIDAFDLLINALQQGTGRADLPQASGLADFTGLGTVQPGQRVTDWEQFLTDSVGADGAVERMAGEVIAGTPLHHYRATFAHGADAAPVTVALNRTIAAGCEAFPIGRGTLRDEAAQAPYVLEVSIGIEDGYPYRATMVSEEDGRRMRVTVASTPMPEPFEITRPI
ncbi:MAG: hypothetical protein ACRDJE_03915 [Dehalococcoidia bacterium]